MANMVEIRLHTLTCEFAGDDGDDLELSGVFTAETFDVENAIKTSNIIFDFPDGLIRLRKGESATIDRAVRVALRSPTDDPVIAGELFVKFGGELVEGRRSGHRRLPWRRVADSTRHRHHQLRTTDVAPLFRQELTGRADRYEHRVRAPVVG